MVATQHLPGAPKVTRLLTEALASFVPTGPAEASVATFLGENRRRLAAMSLDEIAEAAGVSQPTVTRTMVRLGYRNALELRTAAALVDHLDDRRPGALTRTDIRCAAELIASAYDLYIYPGFELQHQAEVLFKNVFPKSRVDLPMKPQLRRPHTTPVQVEPILDSRDAVLVLALADLPSGHNLASLASNAREAGAPILLLQSSDFAYHQSTLTVSLGLPAGTHPDLAAVLLSAAAAAIRMEADRLNAGAQAAG